MRCLSAVLLLIFAVSAGAQNQKNVPKRPRAAIADTNDARAYLVFGQRQFEHDPGAAMAAFYWAARLDPTMAEAHYGHYAASIASSGKLMNEWWRGSGRGGRSKDMQKLDSLYLRALVIDPFFYRGLERTMIMMYLRDAIQREARSTGERVDVGELNYYLEGMLRTADPGMRGFVAYSDGNFDAALEHYARAVKSERYKAGYRMARGRIFGRTNRPDSAIAEFTLALEEMRKRDEKDLVVLYDSKAMLEQSIGVLLEAKDDPAGAKEAFGRALAEDLAYYPAHLRLGLLAVAARDTATALSEMELAAQVAPNEPYVRHTYGFTLASAGRYKEATEQYRKATELEPFWAVPYMYLGDALAQAGDRAAATEAYTAFLTRAPRSDVRRREVEQHLAQLRQ